MNKQLNHSEGINQNHKDKFMVWGFIILCLILFVYLGLKTLPENGWSGWYEGLGDAQALLSIKHWAKDGFINSKFLAIPIGYSKIVQYLDDPAMRHHARGTTTGELIGKRLYYTHYPSGYLFPYALLMKAGVTQRPYFRLLALLFSFTALIFLYWFFNLILSTPLEARPRTLNFQDQEAKPLRSSLVNNSASISGLLTGQAPLISFLAIFYYSISTMFLDYADSLANQPLDDLFRAIILVLSVLAVTRPHTKKVQTFYDVGVWFFYFLLSISSYDSTFFVFIWLVGLDIITKWRLIRENAEPRTKWLKAILVRGLFFASAPILGFVLQMLQNWWYLGNWHEVWFDAFGASLAKVQTGNIWLHFKDIFYTFSLMIGFKTFLASLFVAVLFFAFWRLKKEETLKEKNFWLLAVFFLAGAVYPFIFVGSGGFSYQGRQMMPLIALLVGLATIWIVRVFQDKPPRQKFWCGGKEKINILLFSVLIITVVFLWGGQIYRTVQYVYDWPNNKANDYVIQLSKSLRPMVSGDSAVFYQGDKLSVNSLAEYYFDMPIFSFEKEENLIKDLLWFKKNSRYSFEAIVMTDQKEISNNLRRAMLEQKFNKIEDSKFIQGEYVFKVLP